MFLQNFRETGQADANAACPYRAGHDKGRLWGVSGLEVVIDGNEQLAFSVPTIWGAAPRKYAPSVPLP